jgi:hypothetical protein
MPSLLTKSKHCKVKALARSFCGGIAPDHPEWRSMNAQAAVLSAYVSRSPTATWTA